MFDLPANHPDRNRHLLAVEQALTIAESVVVSNGDTPASRDAANAATFAAQDAGYDSAHVAAFAAAHAANASAAACTATATAAATSAHAAAANASLAADTMDSIAWFTVAARQDFERLKARGLGEYPEAGQTFSLSTRSFLGRLWPGGDPDWYQPALRKMRKSLKEAAAATETESPKPDAPPAKKADEKPADVKREIKSIWQKLEGIKGAPEEIADLKSAVATLGSQIEDIRSRTAISAFRKESKAALDKQVETLGAVERQAAERMNSISTASTEISQLNSRVADADKNLNEAIRIRIEKSKDSVSEELAQIEGDVRKKIASHQQAVNDKIRTNEAKTYWETKKKSHTTAFWIGISATAIAAAGSL